MKAPIYHSVATSVWHRAADAERGCDLPRDLRDPESLRAALGREHCERRRAECRANIQAEVVKLALDLLVREPDIQGFFGALTNTVVRESHTCAVWLIDETQQRCELWMACVGDRLVTPPPAGSPNPAELENQWWRVILIEAVARQAALALHQSRLIEQQRGEERRY